MYAQFDYIRPENESELIAILARRQPGTLLYAGGTDVIVKLRAHIIEAKHLVDVKGISSFNAIEQTTNLLRIGCAVTLTGIAEHLAVKTHVPALAQGCAQVGSVPIRNKATLIGNIQNASPAADGLNAIWGLDARMVLLSERGERRIPVNEYVLGPGKTAIEADEVAAFVEIPIEKWDYQGFFKSGRRRALAISVVNGMTAFRFSGDGTVEAARICAGAVAPTPLRLIEAEGLITGKRITPQLAQQVAQTVLKGVKPITDIRATANYRSYISGVEIRRQIINAMETVL